MNVPIPGTLLIKTESILEVGRAGIRRKRGILV